MAIAVYIIFRDDKLVYFKAYIEFVNPKLEK